MNAGICHLAVVPMRAEASHCSEMVSQLLFGETYRVLETADEWVRIQTLHDSYEGWIQRKQFFGISEEVLDNYLKSEKVRLKIPFLMTDVNVPKVLTMGALMSVNPEDLPFGGKMPDPTPSCWLPETALQEDSLDDRLETLSQAALSMIGSPYLWGGRTPLGIDCSGFTQLLYSLVGVQLPRDASQQVLSGTPVDFIHESCAGDLAFFHNEEGCVVHVGMMLNNHEIIHSSGQVRVDRMDETGIFNADIQRYTHYLRVVKRIFC